MSITFAELQTLAADAIQAILDSEQTNAQVTTKLQEAKADIEAQEETPA